MISKPMVSSLTFPRVEIQILTCPLGMLATITKEVAKTAVNAIAPMFERLRTNSKATSSGENVSHLSFADFDWAIHPGGAAILQGAQKNLQLSNDHIRASLDVYSSYGNTSSSSVLIVLDKMRHMGKGRNEVIATSFGPGIMIEMFRMRRSREGDRIDRTTSIWARIYRRLMMLRSQRVTTEKKISNLPGMSRIDSIHT